LRLNARPVVVALQKPRPRDEARQVCYATRDTRVAESESAGPGPAVCASRRARGRGPREILVLLQQLLVLNRHVYHMKRAISMLLFALCCSACVATRKDWIVTGGNQANGTVELSYQYKDREVPQTNEAQAHVVANLACHEWGYSNSRTFGPQIKNCNQPAVSLEDCTSWTVTRQYRCIGAASH
jgi:hypothetical protein